MKSIILFPFRVIAFFIRLVLKIITIPLIILIRILGLLLPQTARSLRSMIDGFNNIFRF